MSEMEGTRKPSQLHRVTLRRPVSRYWIVAGGCLVAWWCYQSGQKELAMLALLWGVSEF